MGKKRVVAKTGSSSATVRSVKRSKKFGSKKLNVANLHIQATYNNTKLSLHDSEGNLVLWATSGGLGFSGAKKGTTFAAGRVAEQLAGQMVELGVKDVNVVVKGVGSGREAALRSFAAKGINISSIRDATPIPFNGPKARKSRRV